MADDSVAQESALYRWFPELASLAGAALIILALFVPHRITTGVLGLCGLVVAAYAAKVRKDVGY